MRYSVRDEPSDQIGGLRSLRPADELDREYMRRKWARTIPRPSVSVIVGRRGGGKSATLYRLLQDRSKDEGIPAFVVGLPREKWHLAPPGVTPIAFEQLQQREHAVVGIDEAGMAFYYRAWGDDAHAVMDRLVSISRQKDLIILFVVHTLRKLDVALVLDADAVVYKEPSFMHARLERREVRNMTREALEKFQALPVEDRKRHAYVFSHDAQGEMLTIELPEGWTEDLSVAFAGIAVEDGVRPRSARQDRVERVLEDATRVEGELTRQFAHDADTARMIPHVEAEIRDVPAVEGEERISKEIEAVRRAFPRELSDEEVVEQVVATFSRNRVEVESFFKN